MTPALIVAAVAAVVIGGLVWALIVQRKEIERLYDCLNDRRKKAFENMMEAHRARIELAKIADATRDGKSGTARKVHRMAVEALSGDKPA